MILFLIALFVIGPIAEISVLLAAGQAFGAWPVILACIATAVIGGIMLRIQGLNALNSLSRDLDEGRVPVEAAADGVFLAVAAPLLMTPGFITDAIGFFLLVPPARHWIAREALKRLRRKVEAGSATIHIYRG
jgi:UPF0716 protein FxsA